MLSRRVHVLSLILSASLAITGCGDDDTPVDPDGGFFPFDMPPAVDAGEAGVVDLGRDAAARVCETPGSTLGVSCVTTADCNDGCFCNGFEVCLGGSCTAGADPCVDAFACTTAACDEDADTCSSTTDDTTCDDTNPCNGAERCDAIDGCRPGSTTAPRTKLGCSMK